MRTNTASPCELIRDVAVSSGSRALLWGVCFIVFSFFTTQSLHAQTKPATPQPPSCEVKKPTDKTPSAKTPPAKTVPAKPAAAQPKVAAAPPTKGAPPKTAPAQKAATASRQKPKPQPAPLVSTRTKAKAEAITSELSTDLPSNVEQEISKFFGLRYRFGAEGAGGIDCSALVKQVYSDVFGVNLPRSSTEQSQLGQLEYVPNGDLKTGDLVFFGPNRKKVNHVGMYLAGGHFLHAARSEGVTISRLDDAYWKSRFMFSKRMRGLDAGEDDDDLMEGFRGHFSQDSYRLALNRDSESDVSFLDVGVKVNSSLELLLSGFFLSSLADHGPSGDLSTSTGLNGPESQSDGGGFRLSAVLSPFEWMKLVPSVTQVDVRDDRSRDYQKFGLETWMILPSTRLSVFMGAYARNQDDLFDRPFNSSPDWQTMDMALGLHYQLSESLRFSLWGTHVYSPDPRVNEDSSSRRTPVDDVSFQLNIKF